MNVRATGHCDLQPPEIVSREVRHKFHHEHAMPCCMDEWRRARDVGQLESGEDLACSCLRVWKLVGKWWQMGPGKMQRIGKVGHHRHAPGSQTMPKNFARMKEQRGKL